jgi:hypothetical protein
LFHSLRLPSVAKSGSEGRDSKFSWYSRSVNSALVDGTGSPISLRESHTVSLPWPLPCTTTRWPSSIAEDRCVFLQDALWALRYVALEAHRRLKVDQATEVSNAIEAVVAVRIGDLVFWLRFASVHSFEEFELGLVRIVIGAEALFVTADASDEADALSFLATLFVAFAAIAKPRLMRMCLRSISGVHLGCSICMPQSPWALGLWSCSRSRWRQPTLCVGLLRNLRKPQCEEKRVEERRVEVLEILGLGKAPKPDADNNCAFTALFRSKLAWSGRCLPEHWLSSLLADATCETKTIKVHHIVPPGGR